MPCPPAPHRCTGFPDLIFLTFITAPIRHALHEFWVAELKRAAGVDHGV